MPIFGLDDFSSTGCPCSLGLAQPKGYCHKQVDEGRDAKIAAFPLLTCRYVSPAPLARSLSLRSDAPLATAVAPAVPD